MRLFIHGCKFHLWSLWQPVGVTFSALYVAVPSSPAVLNVTLTDRIKNAPSTPSQCAEPEEFTSAKIADAI